MAVHPFSSDTDTTSKNHGDFGWLIGVGDCGWFENIEAEESPLPTKFYHPFCPGRSPGDRQSWVTEANCPPIKVLQRPILSAYIIGEENKKNKYRHHTPNQNKKSPSIKVKLWIVSIMLQCILETSWYLEPWQINLFCFPIFIFGCLYPCDDFQRTGRGLLPRKLVAYLLKSHSNLKSY